MTSSKNIQSRSIDFLLKNAGPVIQYRLRKEILNDLPKNEEKTLLNQIYDLPYFKLIEKYAKPNGYIGSGMHSLDHWRGQVLHETPLQYPTAYVDVRLEADYKQSQALDCNLTFWAVQLLHIRN